MTRRINGWQRLFDAEERKYQHCQRVGHNYAERLTHLNRGMAIVVICLRCGHIDRWLEREEGNGTEARQAAKERNIPMLS